MHGVAGDLPQVTAIAEQARRYDSVDVALCVPAILIERAVRAVPGFPIGAQDVHHAEAGAFTGCVSAQMLHDAGARLTIVGHSERRDAQRETDSEVRDKAAAALGCGLQVILCVGESLKQRDDGKAVETVIGQLENSLPEGADARISIAYEPIWAIGTGKVPTNGEIAEMHGAIRQSLERRCGSRGQAMRILYGGSVKASNAPTIFAVADVDGALVGGASLTAEQFVPIIAAAAAG